MREESTQGGGDGVIAISGSLFFPARAREHDAVGGATIAASGSSECSIFFFLVGV